MYALAPTRIGDTSQTPPRTSKFSFTAAPMLAPSPTDSRSGARTEMRLMAVSCPIRAPSARRYQACSGEPASRCAGGMSMMRSTSHQR